MKYFGLILALGLLSGQAMAQADDVGLQFVEVTPTAVYTPMGFGENNVAQIGVEGEFPNGCYRLVSIEHKVKRNKIFVRGRAIKFTGPCLQVITPWFQLHDIALLKEGKYEIHKWKNSETALGQLPIKHSDSRAMVDEKDYAAVNSVQTEQLNNGQIIATISGYLTNTCMRIEPDKVQVLRTNDHVIEILPELTWVVPSTQGACAERVSAFKIEVALPELDRLPGKYMIYTRVRGNTGIAKLEHFWRE